MARRRDPGLFGVPIAISVFAAGVCALIGWGLVEWFAGRGGAPLCAGVGLLIVAGWAFLAVWLKSRR